MIHKLRLTCLETYIKNEDIEMQDAPIFAGLERETLEEQTPKPKKKAASKCKGDNSESKSDHESDSFQTPKVLKKRLVKRAEFLTDSDANSMDLLKTDLHVDGRTETESEDARKSVAQTHQQNKGESHWMLPSHY
jgi:pyrroloquinoline quinone (PQQ) biosynthesis protein C